MTTTMTKDEVLEQVRVNLLRFLDKHKNISSSILAADVHYSYDAIAKFANGERVTVPMATALVEIYPELGEGMVCPHCARLMFSFR